jgi:uncharacterized C2H2 Zn-finger protein
MNDTNILFRCIYCDYTTSRKSDYTKHLSTRKHQKHENKNKFIENASSIHKLYTSDEEILINESELEYSLMNENELYDEEIDNLLFCSCGRQYSSRQSLHVHSKKCKRKNIDNTLNNNLNFINVNESIIFELIKDNRELKELLIEQNKTIQEIVKNNTLCISNNITNNSNNKTFNLNFFLNEECKNAINIRDFINSIEFGLEDLEETGRVGFVEGISKVVIKNLTDLDINLRPIHCGDIKREILYIKNNNKWEKDNKSKNLIKCAIQEIANKNIKKISDWIKCHPDCQNSESTQNTKYLNIVLNSMSGSTIEEQQSNYDKIITRVAREVAIRK